MSINMILGRPGAGKSYEAVVFHILEAVKAGRKVITNIPLQLDHFSKVFGPSVLELLDVRQFGFNDYGQKRPFSTPDEYMDPWRNADGVGPLYVIDECHLSLPKGKTPIEIEEWYSLHRHYGVDILLITQSYSKVSKVIVEMVEIVYRCGKARFLGLNSSYVRKTQDGFKGEVVHTEIRKYKKAYFPFYKSHTQSNAAVNEAALSDVKPIYKQWYSYAAGFGILSIIWLVSTASNPVATADAAKSAVVSRPVESAAPVPSVPAVTAPTSAPRPAPVPPPPAPAPVPAPSPSDHPFSAVSMSIDGHATYTDNGRRITVAWFALVKAGRVIARLDNSELELAGYTVEVRGDCLARVSYQAYSRWVICDAPPADAPAVETVSLGDSASAATLSAVGIGQETGAM